jgi:hypothetical protein
MRLAKPVCRLFHVLKTEPINWKKGIWLLQFKPNSTEMSIVVIVVIKVQNLKLQLNDLLLNQFVLKTIIRT